MRKVLLVEDDKYLNKLMSDRLLLKGLDVTSCLDGEHAWKALSDEPDAYELLILDMLLPKMMGAELLSRINETPSLSELRRIGISGVYKDKDQVREISQLHHLESYWTKPFDLDELVASICGENRDPADLRSSTGSLHEKPIERIYFEAYEAGFTGRLVIKNQGQERRVYFMNGHPVAADSNSISESFGSFLVNTGQISEDTREKVSRKMVEEKMLFGEMLVKLQLFSKDQLFALLRKHTYQLLLNSFLSRQGDFNFEKMADIPAHLPRIEFNPFLLMIAAQSRLISSSALRSLMEVKKDLFPKLESRVGQLLPLLNLKPGVAENFQNLSTETAFLDAAQSLSEKEQESFLRALYLFDSIQLLTWENPQQSESTDLKVPHIDFSPLLGEEQSSEAVELEQRISSEYMDTLNKNFFEILEVPTDADEKQIEEAYRSLRFQKHPDRYGPGLSGQGKRILDDILSRLDQAYQTLSSADLRKEYLQTIHRLSASSVADSQLYLQALDLHREGKALLDQGQFLEAKAKFEKAHQTWRSGVEYQAYAVFCEFKLSQNKEDRLETSRVLHRLRELAYSNLQSEVCFVLLGHAYKSSDQKDAAREAYRKALDLNVNSAEAENSLAGLAEKAPSTWQKEIPVSSKSAFKGLGYLVGFVGACVAAFFASQTSNVDLDALELSPQVIENIFVAQNIRHKKGMTKVFVRDGSITAMPDAVLESKCVQAFEKLSLYGSTRIYLIEEKKGIKAVCTDENLQRFK